MGLFDAFRKRVREVADETDEGQLSTEATSEEAKAVLNALPAEEEDWDEVEELPQSIDPPAPIEPCLLYTSPSPRD